MAVPRQWPSDATQVVAPGRKIQHEASGAGLKEQPTNAIVDIVVPQVRVTTGQLFPDTPPIASISALETTLRWTWRRACVEQSELCVARTGGTLLVSARRIGTLSNERPY